MQKKCVPFIILKLIAAIFVVDNLRFCRDRMDREMRMGVMQRECPIRNNYDPKKDRKPSRSIPFGETLPFFWI